MKGDLSRGFHPDRKRGRRYRRVLLQQGRLLLDSDVAALVDATDQHLRDLGRNLGCRSGSPDLGYLITPGKLQAIFDTLDDVVADPAVEAVRDFSRKYLDRVPSLKLRTGAAAGTVTIQLWDGLSGPDTFAFWTRADAATNVTVTVGAGTSPLVVPASPTFQRVEVAVSGPAAALTLNLPANAEIWLALVESDEDAAAGPHFWAAPGIYGVDGLWVENAAHGGYPAVSFPSLAPDVTSLQQTNKRWVAYLEVHERVVTAAEDPGIREEALGGKLDTTLRTEVVGQIKVADGAALTSTEIKDAFASIALPTGTLIVNTASVIPDPDPCAVPLAGGYTGRSNRLYHFEVHAGGALGTAVFKWSRDGGGPVVPVAVRTGTTLTFARSSGLENGDLVEVLTDALELADTDLAAFGGGSFNRPPRAAGVLALLSRKESDAQGRERFDLLDPQNPSAASTLPLPAFDSAVPVKVRRWDGRIVTTAAGGPDPKNTVELEDGIAIELRGPFEVGDFWQYEARVRQQNANGPWKATPHGPERRFTPLALLQYPASAANTPMLLLEWLDERYSRLCTLEADDIAFDGGRLGEPSDTVQEIIETLIERGGGGCCDVTLRPQAGGDDAARVTDLLGDELHDGGVLCLRPGVYRFRQAVIVPPGRRLTIRGCPDALIENVGGGAQPQPQPLFVVQGELTLEDLTLLSRSTGADPLIQLDGDAPSLEATRVGFLRRPVASGTAMGIAIRAHDAKPVPPNPSDIAVNLDAAPAASALLPASLSLDACVIVGDAAAIGRRWNTFGIRNSACYATTLVVSGETFDRIELDRSVLATGLPVNALDGASATTDRLATDAEEFLDVLPGMPLGPPAGVALSAGQLLGGHVHGCAVSAELGLFAHELRDLCVDDCAFRGSDGVRFHNAADLRLRRNQMTVSATAVLLRIAARRVVVNGNRIDASMAVRAGRVDGTDMLGLTVAHNDIRARELGIDLGPPNLVTICRLISVVIRGNRIYQADGQVLPVGITARCNPAADRLVRILDNEIAHAFLAVDVARVAVELSNNHIVLPTRTGGTAISLTAVQRATIEDNTVDGMRAGGGVSVGIVGTGLGPTRVAGNSVRAIGQVRPLELTMGSASTAEVANNDFGIGTSAVTGGIDRVVLRDNRFAGPVTISAATGILSDNLFGDAAESLVVSRVSEWQATGNRALGALRFLPGRRLFFDVGDVGDIVVSPGLTTRPRLTNPLATVAVLGDRAILDTLGHSAIDDSALLSALGGASALALVNDAPGTSTTGPLALDLDRIAVAAATTADLRGEWNESIRDALLDALAADLGDDLALLSFRELAYQAQVANNWANTLQVGFLFPADKTANPTLPEGSANPNLGTRVQVVGNRADTRLIVNRYQKRVVAQNLVNDLVEAGSQLTEIISPNLEF